MTARRPLALVSGVPVELPSADPNLTASDVYTAAPGAPSVTQVASGVRTLAGSDWPAFRAAQGIERIVMPHMGRTTTVGLYPTGQIAASNYYTYQGTVAGNYTPLGTVAARTLSKTSKASNARRTGYDSAATAGSIAGLYHLGGAAAPYTLGDGSGNGGFFFIARFVPSDPATVSGARMLVALSSATGAPTNVDPAAQTNQIGVAQLSGGTNLQIVFGGSVAQTPIDLGANFPGSGASADLYELILFSDPNDNTKVGYRVEKLGSGVAPAAGTLTNTTPGTTLPATSTYLGPRVWRTNNATALAVGVDVCGLVGQYDF